ncbi:MAG: ABC transporter permease [Candidatus Obscuribacterales bacterium]|nr:ABC transporter permease [Candidatus Obscuribacterales bacterium]
MPLFELVKIAWQSIVANRMRSSLTVLGIIIGIAAVITLLAIGQGAKQEAAKQIQALGTNVLMLRAGAASTGHVSLGGGSAATLSWEDAKAIKETCPAVVDVAPGIMSNQQLQYGGQNTLTTVTATTPAYTEVRNFYPLQGRFVSDTDVDHARRVCVLGQTVITNLFGNNNPIGKSILIRGELFEVIGTMELKGATQFMDMDDQIFIPLTTAYSRLVGNKSVSGHSVNWVVVKVERDEDVLPAEFQITNLLRRRHKITPPFTDDFMLRTQKEFAETAESVTGIFTTLLGSTAGISLLVGGIGVMNIMLVSVTERTREIGIRKALGAKQSDIMSQFVIEATVLSLSGGISGILLGLIVSYAIAFFAKWTTLVTVESVVLSFAVSLVVGLFFGIYPASKAAKLDPITALRSD